MQLKHRNLFQSRTVFMLGEHGSITVNGSYTFNYTVYITLFTYKID